MKDTLTLADTVSVRDTIYIPAKQPLKAALAKADTVPKKTDYRSLPAEIILFSSGQSAVRKVCNCELICLVSVLKKDTTLTLHLTGHPDPTGPDAMNEALSLKSALAVKNYFKRKGIAEHRFATSSAGSEDPVTTAIQKRLTVTTGGWK